MRYPKQTIYVRNLSEFYAVEQKLEEQKARWLGFDEVAYRKRKMLREMWETKDGVRIDIVLKIPRRLRKRLLDVDLIDLLH